MSESNPYQPPVDQRDVALQHPIFRFRIVPVLLVSLVGLACATLGLAAISHAIMLPSDDATWQGLFAGLIFLGFGIAWVASGWLHFRERYRFGMALNVASTLICAFAFSVLK